MLHRQHVSNLASTCRMSLIESALFFQLFLVAVADSHEDDANIEDYEADLCLLFHNILDAGTEHLIKEVRFLPES